MRKTLNEFLGGLRENICLTAFLHSIERYALSIGRNDNAVNPFTVTLSGVNAVNEVEWVWNY